MNELEHLYFNSKRDLDTRKQIHQEEENVQENKPNVATWQAFVVLGKLDGLNEYTKANRSNIYMGAKMKKQNEEVVSRYIKKHKLKKVRNYPVKLEIEWCEPNAKRDIDNISFATKFILDALVKQRIIENDGQKYVNMIEHKFTTNKEFPHILVRIVERN